MNRVKHLGIASAVVISAFLVFPQMVYASIAVGTCAQRAYVYYIGPGTLTLIMQVVVGLLIGGVTLIAIYRARVKTFLSNLLARRRRGEAIQDSQDSQGGHESE